MIQKINGRSCVDIAPVNYIAGKPPVVYLNVDCVYEEYDTYAKLFWRLLDADGNIVTELQDANPVIEGDDYDNWDGNDLEYAFAFVAGLLNLTIVE